MSTAINGLQTALTTSIEQMNQVAQAQDVARRDTAESVLTTFRENRSFEVPASLLAPANGDIETDQPLPANAAESAKEAAEIATDPKKSLAEKMTELGAKLDEARTGGNDDLVRFIEQQLMRATVLNSDLLGIRASFVPFELMSEDQSKLEDLREALVNTMSTGETEGTMTEAQIEDLAYVKSLVDSRLENLSLVAEANCELAALRNGTAGDNLTLETIYEKALAVAENRGRPEGSSLFSAGDRVEIGKLLADVASISALVTLPKLDALNAVLIASNEGKTDIDELNGELAKIGDMPEGNTIEDDRQTFTALKETVTETLEFRNTHSTLLKSIESENALAKLDDALDVLAAANEVYPQAADAIAKAISDVQARTAEVKHEAKLSHEAFMTGLEKTAENARPEVIHKMVQERQALVRQSESMDEDTQKQQIRELERFDHRTLNNSYIDQIKGALSASMDVANVRTVEDAIGREQNLSDNQKTKMLAHLNKYSSACREGFDTRLETLEADVEKADNLKDLIGLDYPMTSTIGRTLTQNDFAAVTQRYEALETAVLDKMQKLALAKFEGDIDSGDLAALGQLKNGINALIATTAGHPDVLIALEEGTFSAQTLQALGLIHEKKLDLYPIPNDAKDWDKTDWARPDEAPNFTAVSHELDATLRALANRNPELDAAFTELRQACSNNPDRVEAYEIAYQARRELLIGLQENLHSKRLESYGLTKDNQTVSRDVLSALVKELGSSRTLKTVDMPIIRAELAALQLENPDLTKDDLFGLLPKGLKNQTELKNFLDKGLQNSDDLHRSGRILKGFSKSNKVGIHNIDKTLDLLNRTAYGNDTIHCLHSMELYMRHVMADSSNPKIRTASHTKEFDAVELFEKGSYYSHAKRGVLLDKDTFTKLMLERFNKSHSIERTGTRLAVKTGRRDKSALDQDIQKQFEAFVNASPELSKEIAAVQRLNAEATVRKSTILADKGYETMLDGLKSCHSVGRQAQWEALKDGRNVKVKGARIASALLILDRLADMAKDDPTKAQTLAKELRFQKHVDLRSLTSSNVWGKDDNDFRSKLNAFLTAKTDAAVKDAAANLKELFSPEQQNVVAKAKSVIFFKDLSNVYENHAIEKTVRHALSHRERRHPGELSTVIDNIFRTSKADRQNAPKAGDIVNHTSFVNGAHTLAAYAKHQDFLIHRNINRMNKAVHQATAHLSKSLENELGRVENFAFNAAFVQTYANSGNPNGMQALIDERDRTSDITRMPFYTTLTGILNDLKVPKDLIEPMAMHTIVGLQTTTAATIDKNLQKSTRIRGDRLRRTFTPRTHERRVLTRATQFGKVVNDLVNKLDTNKAGVLTFSENRSFGIGVPVVKTEEDMLNVSVHAAIAQKNGLCVWKDPKSAQYHMMVNREGGVKLGLDIDGAKKLVKAHGEFGLNGANIVELTFNGAENCKSFLTPFLSGDLKSNHLELCQSMTPRREFGLDGGIGVQLQMKVPGVVARGIDNALQDAAMQARHEVQTTPAGKKTKAAISHGIDLSGSAVWSHWTDSDGNRVKKRSQQMNFEMHAGLTLNAANPAKGEDNPLAKLEVAYDREETVKHAKVGDQRLLSAERSSSLQSSGRNELEKFLTNAGIGPKTREQILRDAKPFGYRVSVEVTETVPKSFIDKNPRADDHAIEDAYRPELVKVTAMKPEMHRKGIPGLLYSDVKMVGLAAPKVYTPSLEAYL